MHKTFASLLFLFVSCVSAVTVAAPAFKAFDNPGGVYSLGALSMPGAPLYFPSGATAGATPEGDMKVQALETLKRLQQNITDAGLAMDEVAFVRAYLAPGADGTIDYAGWNAAWGEFFGSKAVVDRPARSSVGVPLLGRAGTLIEIEFVCLPAARPGLFSSSEAMGLPVTNPHLKPYGTKEGRILAGVGVLPGRAMYWTAGMTAPVLDSKLPPTDRGQRGDMKTQARNTLLRLQESLAASGLTFKDVVYLRAFLGPDMHMKGQYDYDGWNAAYGEFFNNPATNPHKPSRTTVTTPSFGNPSTMIEIEIVAAFPQPPKVFDAKAINPRLRDYGEPEAMISSGVAVAADASFYFSAGAVGSAGDDVKSQAISTLETLKTRLAAAGLGFQDVVFLRAYVVPEKDGTVDRAGWAAAYSQYFNNPAQPHKPARTTIAVQSLPRPDLKIEIDVVAVAPK
jgi:enamine deaminase RidA (YjgF/YER057c/UK114 family)